MSLVTAAIRPSGASYRDALMNKELNHNPSELIDKLLENNLGYLIYQEDVIAFLQQVCGLTGSEADNVRRAIGRKDKDRLDKAMPQILEGYCQKSDKPREEAETEALIFLKIIEDASSYMFGYNHSIAYCLLGYLCAYYRYYHPGEFITAFLNNAANNDDIKSGTNLIREYGYELSPPRFGYSTSGYTFNNNDMVIAKGLSSVKYISENVADELFQISQERDYNSFIDVLQAIDEHKAADVRQIDVLIKIDYFAQFGNQRTLLRICDMYEKFKRGAIKKMKKEPIAGTVMEHIVQKYATGTNKDGKEAASWTFFDVHGAMAECEQVVREAELSDLPDIIKIKNFSDIMGYVGYVSGKEEDRPKLYVKEVYPLKRKKDGAQFGYSVITQSIGSGRESRFTVYNRVFNKDPIKKDDLIICKGFTREGQYFTLTSYVHIYE